MNFLINSAEYIYFFVITASVIHLVTNKATGYRHFAIALVIIGLSIAVNATKKRFINACQHPIDRLIISYLLGLWIFALCCILGIAQWPLARSVNLSSLVYLLISHLSFVLIVFSSILWINGKSLKCEYIKFGDWGLKGNFKGMLLFLSSFIMLIWTVFFLVNKPISHLSPILIVIIIIIFKAALTGFTEEFIYRGLLLPAAISRFGLPAGMAFQALIYGVFHIHLGAVVFNQIGFVAGVAMLGFIFGIITYYSRGIGWAAISHTLINVVIEWQNLS
jgi:membrane protease YdiL (CAAX protease family)